SGWITSADTSCTRAFNAAMSASVNTTSSSSTWANPIACQSCSARSSSTPAAAATSDFVYCRRRPRTASAIWRCCLSLSRGSYDEHIAVRPAAHLGRNRPENATLQRVQAPAADDQQLGGVLASCRQQHRHRLPLSSNRLHLRGSGLGGDRRRFPQVALRGS